MIKKLAVLICLILLIQSCSTQSKSQTYGMISGAITCGILGAYLGKELSPNHASKDANRVFGGSIGATACGLGGYFLGRKIYQDDPRNKVYEPIKFDQKEVPTTPQEMLNNDVNLDLSDLSIEEKSVFETPFVKELPTTLKSKIEKQKIIKYEIKPQTIKTKDGKILHFSGGEAIEHKYESQ